MKNKAFFILIISTFTFIKIITAQSDTLSYYYDKDLNNCSKNTAYYYGRGIKENGKIRFAIYNRTNGNILFKGFFTDSSLQVKDGPFTYYDSEGLEGSEGVYVNDMEDGYWKEWRDGHLTDSILFNKGEEIARITFLYYENDSLESRVLNDSRTNTKEMTTYDDSGRLTRKAAWIDGTGDQVNYYTNGRIKSVEKYKKNIRESVTYFNEEGTEISEKEIKKEQETRMANLRKDLQTYTPEFPGGTKALHSYFERNFRPPSNMGQQATIVEFMNVQFYLDKKGYAYDIKVENSANFELLQAVQTLFRNMPPWNMKGLSSFGPVYYRFQLTTR